LGNAITAGAPVQFANPSLQRSVTAIIAFLSLTFLVYCIPQLLHHSLPLLSSAHNLLFL
jgi:hypothetical protein